MTIINIRVEAPGNGPRVPVEGAVRWERTARTVTTDGVLVIPNGLTVGLVNGTAAVDVEPSTESWVWRVTEFFAGQPARTRHLAVPAAGPVSYADLVPVDPVTLDPDILLADGGGPSTNFDTTDPLLDGGTV